MFSNSIPSFNGSLNAESTLLWIGKIDGLFDMEYILMEDQVEFVTYKLKGRATTWWNQLQNIRMYQGKPPIRMWSRMKRLLKVCSFTLKEEEIENQPPPFMRFYRPNETAKPHQQPPVEERSTKRESSNHQAIINQAQSLDEVMKLKPSIPSLKKE